MCKVITITAPSSAGKDTILNEIIKRGESLNVKPVVSTTNRPPREYEIDGVDYHFITYEEIMKKLKNEEFIEHREYNTKFGKWIYGITKDSINIESDYVYVCIVDFRGLVELDTFCKRNNIKFKSYYLSVSNWNRLYRSLNREKNCSDEKVEEMCRRLIDDMQNVSVAKNYVDEVIYNETKYDFENTINKILEYVNSPLP